MKSYLEEDVYILNEGIAVKGGNLRKNVLHHAFAYYNTPYVWGGRTPYGIDAAALVQMAYRQVGYALPRRVEGILTRGESLSFLEEALPGDLIFCGDESKITHVGILWEEGRLIHASGRVRVDKIDHHGIFNEELKRYTHSLKMIKRIFPD